MSCRLRELIRAVRACKTAAEERDVIAKESAALREAFREQDPRYRHRNVAKLMYIHMLGYPTHFGQMETLKLIAASGFPEKRIGYLGLMLLLDERQEVLMLVTNSLKMDLNNHRNQYIVGLALAALGNICSAEMARDLSPDVERLLEERNPPYIRKKAALCAIRVLKKNPELVDEFVDRAAALVAEGGRGGGGGMGAPGGANQAVALAGVSLMLTICALDAAAIPRYRAHVPALCNMLRGLLQGGFNPEYDVGGITDPYLQVKVLQLLRVLGAGNAAASDAMTDILAQVAAGVEGGRNGGWAILYEAVATIMGIETVGGLRVMAVNILGRFLAARDNNIRYVALNTLAKVVAVDTQAVQRHRSTIVECVKDADVSIRRRALELVYCLVNEGNIRNLTRELLDYLALCDAEFKPDLTAKIAALITRFAPDRRWHLDSLLCVLSQAGGHVKEGVVHGLIALITNADELQAYAVRRLYAALHTALADPAASSPALLYAAAWCIGEYGELLPAGRGGPLLEGEPPLSVSEADVAGLLERLAGRRPRLPPAVLEVALTAAAKLTSRLPSQVAGLSALVARHKGSVLLEVQSRCCEYSSLLAGHAGLAGQLLERMPAMEGGDGGGGSGATTPSGAAPGGGSAAGAAGAPAAAAAGDDLVDLLGGLDAAAAAVGSVSGGGGGPPSSSGGAVPRGGGLDDLLAGPSAVAPSAAPAAAGVGGGADVLDLLGGGAGGASSSGPATRAAVPLDDLLGGVGGLAGAGPSSSSGSGAAGGGTMVVFDQDSLRITFDIARTPGVAGGATITATATNAGLEDVADFSLQAAVPKFLSLRLEPASGSSIPSLGGTVRQTLHVVNGSGGAKPLIMRVRLGYSRDGGPPQSHQLEVANFPPGF